MEEWKRIEHSPNYEVSTFGNVRHLLRKENLKPRFAKTSHGGRYDVHIADVSGKQRNQKVHRLVAEAFLLNPDNKECVDHIDGNTANNAVCNLRWATKSENGLNPNNKLYTNNTSGHKGIYFNKPSQQWQILYYKDRKIIHGGLFKTIEEAIANYNPDVIALPLRGELKEKYISKKRDGFSFEITCDKIRHRSSYKTLEEAIKARDLFLSHR